MRTQGHGLAKRSGVPASPVRPAPFKRTVAGGYDQGADAAGHSLETATRSAPWSYGYSDSSDD
jgi:hypothetical protein